mgnify:CR=1 FL=1
MGCGVWRARARAALPSPTLVSSLAPLLSLESTTAVAAARASVVDSNLQKDLSLTTLERERGKRGGAFVG